MRALIFSHDPSLTLLLLSMFLTSLASSDTKLLPQYMSKRYGWTFADTGYLLSCKAIINAFLLSMVVPRILRAQQTLSPQSLPSSSSPPPPPPSSPPPPPSTAQPTTSTFTYRAAKSCLWASVAGAVLIASSYEIWLLVISLAVYAVGAALPIFTNSLLVAIVLRAPLPRSVSRVRRWRDDGDGARKAVLVQVWSVTMLVKAVGSLVGAPLMAVAWAWGIGAGAVAQGAPFYVSALVYFVAIRVFPTTVFMYD